MHVTHALEHRLAACIVLATHEAGGDTSSTSDVYWHTREACFEIARGSGHEGSDPLTVTWGIVLHAVSDMEGLRWGSLGRLEEIAGEMWIDTQAPIVSVMTVHGR